MASPGSPFFTFLGCSNDATICTGTASQCKSFIHHDLPDSHNVFHVFLFFIQFLAGVESSFPDFSVDNIKWSIIYLIALLVTSRVVTFLALTHLDYRATWCCNNTRHRTCVERFMLHTLSRTTQMRISNFIIITCYCLVSISSIRFKSSSSLFNDMKLSEIISL